MSYIVYENVSDLILVFRPSDAEAAAKVLGDLSARWASLFESTIEGCIFTDGTILRVYKRVGGKFLQMSQTEQFRTLMEESLACGLLVNPIMPITD